MNLSVIPSFLSIKSFWQRSIISGITQNVFQKNYWTLVDSKKSINSSPSHKVVFNKGRFHWSRYRGLIQQYNTVRFFVGNKDNLSLDQLKLIHEANLRSERANIRKIAVIVVLSGALVYLFSSLRDVKCPLYGLITKFILYSLDPDVAHDFVIFLAKHDLLPRDLDKDDNSMVVDISGIKFPNPIGLAAGFDKDGDAPYSFIKMGYGFVEVGSVTPLPQPGNPKPRIFHLLQNKSIINRCGFNSKGIDYMRDRFEANLEKIENDKIASSGIVGINFGKNKLSDNMNNDVSEGIKNLGMYADYIVVNVSSPNTLGLRDYQKKDNLRKIIITAKNEIEKLNLRLNSSNEHEHNVATIRRNMNHRGDVSFKPLLFIKISPDLTQEEKKDIAELALEMIIDGLIISNTTIQRPSNLNEENKHQEGGLSGYALRDLSSSLIFDMYKLLSGRIPIIACGGISSGVDALEKIECGASLCQLYTAMIYNGPIIARKIKDELSYLLYKKGYKDLKSAVGVRHKSNVHHHSST